jgi:hypothetical protein
MSYSNPPALPGPLPPGRYAVQLLAPRDPAPSGRFAVERVGPRYHNEHVRAEFVLVTPIDLVKRELRHGDRVHAEQKVRKGTRTLVRRVEVTADGSMLLYPLRTARGPKPKPINAADVVVMGLVTGTYAQFRM